MLRPRWRASCHVEVLNDSTVLLLDETGYALLNGRIYALLAPLLDGQHTQEEIVGQLESQVFFPEITYAIEVAERAGHVIESGPNDPESAPFWHPLGVDTNTVAARLRDARVTVEALGGIDALGMDDALALLQVTTGTDGTFRLVLTDDYLRPEIDALNRRALASREPWMLVRPVGRLLWLGPIFRPGNTACWACLAQRLRANRQLELFIERQQGHHSPLRMPVASIPTTLRCAFDLAATEVAKALVLGARPGGLESAVVTVDIRTLQTERHVVLRRPQCPVCGNADYARRSPVPILLRPHRKERDNDGGHRAMRPEETHERFKHHVSSISGVVLNLEPLGEGTRNGLTFTYSAGHNFALMNLDLRFVLQNLRGRAGGKGMTDVQAKVGAICEAIERYSGVHRGDEISRLASYDEIAAEAIHPNEIMRFSDDQYQGREAWNSEHGSGYHKVPERFDETRRVYWTPAYSLSRGGFRWIPSAYAYFGHPDLKEWFFCSSDSNGNAAGNTLEEAILQGFFELVERDAVALWWYNRLRRPAVDLDSFAEPYAVELREYYARIQRDLWVLDITSDLGVPTFAAVCRRNDHAVEDIIVGFGAHFDPRVALLRALTEINQFMPAVVRRDDKGGTVYWFPDPEAVAWWKTATIERDAYLRPDPATGARRRTDFTDMSTTDFAADVQQCVDIVGRAGLEMLVLDQTQPDIGLNVAKVIVPGMRHFWKRFAPGRLYDVPVKMGWLPCPVPEAQLNPVGIFF